MLLKLYATLCMILVLVVGRTPVASISVISVLLSGYKYVDYAYSVIKATCPGLKS